MQDLDPLLGMEQGPTSGCTEFARQVSTMVASRNTHPRQEPVSSHAVLSVSLWVMRSGWTILHAALLLHIISIATPYWIVSKTDDYHDGIWPKAVDPVCAHVLYPDHLTGEPRDWRKTAIAADFDSQCGSLGGSYYVRDPMDDWIKGVQAPMVLGTIFLLLAVIVINYRAFAPESYFTTALIFITMCSAFTSGAFTLVAVCVFGLRYHTLLLPHNYDLSWSYAFAVVPCIFALFSSILLLTELHVHIVIVPLNKKQNQGVMQQSMPSSDQSQPITETLQMATIGSTANHGHGSSSASAQPRSTMPNMISYSDRPDLKFSVNPHLASKTDMFCSQRGEARVQSGIVSHPPPLSEMGRSENAYVTDLSSISSSAPPATEFRELTRNIGPKQAADPTSRAKLFESAQTEPPCSRVNSPTSNHDQNQSSASSTDYQTQRSQSMSMFSRNATKDPFCVENELKAQERKPIESSASLTEEYTKQNTSKDQLDIGSSVKHGGPRLGPLLALRHQMQNKSTKDDPFCVQTKPAEDESMSQRHANAAARNTNENSEDSHKIPSTSHSGSLLARRHQMQHGDQTKDPFCVQSKPEQKVQNASKTVESENNMLISQSGVEHTDQVDAEKATSKSQPLEARNDPNISLETGKEVTQLDEKIKTKSKKHHKRKPNNDNQSSQLEISVIYNYTSTDQHSYSDDSDPVVVPKRRSKQKRRKDTPRTEQSHQRNLQLAPSTGDTGLYNEITYRFDDPAEIHRSDILQTEQQIERKKVSFKMVGKEEATTEAETNRDGVNGPGQPDDVYTLAHAADWSSSRSNATTSKRLKSMSNDEVEC